MISKDKKRLEITLTNDEYALLESLSSRFSISKSNVIKQSLKVFASKRKHGWTTWIQETNTKSQPSTKEDIDKEIEGKTWEEICDDINSSK